MSGFIYAIESAGHIKIGYSENPEKRLTKMATDSPFPCELLAYWPGSVSDELEIHTKFQSTRVRGEWFASTSALLAFIAENMIHRTNRPLARFEVSDKDSPLAAWRKTERRTLQECAAAVGVTTGAWSQWETGTCRIAGKRLRSVADLTGLSLETLLCDLPKPPKQDGERA